MVYLLGVSREYGNLLYGDYMYIYIYIYIYCVCGCQNYGFFLDT